MKMTQKEGADVSEGGTATLIPDETITATFNGLSDAHTAEMTLSEGNIRAFQFDAESAAGKIISGLNEGDVVTFGYIVDKRNWKRLHKNSFDFERYLKNGCEPYTPDEDTGAEFTAWKWAAWKKSRKGLLGILLNR